MLDRESLADHAADRQADIVHARDRERVEHRGDVAGQRLHRVVAGNRIAAAVAAHVEAQHAEPGLQQRRHLLGPTAAVGSQRVRNADDGAVLRARQGRNKGDVLRSGNSMTTPPWGGRRAEENQVYRDRDSRRG